MQRTRASAVSDAAHRARRRRRRKRILVNAAGVLVLLVFGFPVYWMVLTSFRRAVDIQSTDPSLAPMPGTLDNYRSVFERDFFFTALRNSLVVTLITVALALVIAFVAAVAVSRYRFRGRKAFIVAIRSQSWSTTRVTTKQRIPVMTVERCWRVKGRRTIT